jgi:PHD/YefM family antitoxin component YafN of YafNO toxin-antitoxin module
MKHVTAATAQKNFDILLNNVTRYNEPVTIISNDDQAAILLSMEEWRGIQETLYLQSIPGMVESIKAAAAEPLEFGVPASEVDFNV